MSGRAAARRSTMALRLRLRGPSGGATINVPIFIEEGEEIKVDTEDGKYLGRAN